MFSRTLLLLWLLSPVSLVYADPRWTRELFSNLNSECYISCLEGNMKNTKSEFFREKSNLIERKNIYVHGERFLKLGWIELVTTAGKVGLNGCFVLESPRNWLANPRGWVSWQFQSGAKKLGILKSLWSQSMMEPKVATERIMGSRNNKSSAKEKVEQAKKPTISLLPCSMRRSSHISKTMRTISQQMLPTHLGDSNLQNVTLNQPLHPPKRHQTRKNHNGRMCLR